MAVTMQQDKREVASINPDWLPKRIPLWLSINHAVKLLHRSDRKSLSERARQLGVESRVHPYDHRKKQLNMLQLLERLDFDVSEITFTVPESARTAPIKPIVRKQKPGAIAYVGTSTARSN